MIRIEFLLMSFFLLGCLERVVLGIFCIDLFGVYSFWIVFLFEVLVLDLIFRRKVRFGFMCYISGFIGFSFVVILMLEDFMFRVYI